MGHPSFYRYPAIMGVKKLRYLCDFKLSHFIVTKHVPNMYLEMSPSDYEYQQPHPISYPSEMIDQESPSERVPL